MRALRCLRLHSLVALARAFLPPTSLVVRRELGGSGPDCAGDSALTKPLTGSLARGCRSSVGCGPERSRDNDPCQRRPLNRGLELALLGSNPSELQLLIQVLDRFGGSSAP